jgi:cellulase
VNINQLCIRPIYDVTKPDIICNGGANPLKKPFSTKIIQLKAGDTVTTVWHHTLDSNQGSDKSDPIDSGHLGPTMAYMAKVSSALQANVTGLKCNNLAITRRQKLIVNRV